MTFELLDIWTYFSPTGLQIVTSWRLGFVLNLIIRHFGIWKIWFWKIWLSSASWPLWNSCRHPGLLKFVSAPWPMFKLLSASWPLWCLMSAPWPLLLYGSGYGFLYCRDFHHFLCLWVVHFLLLFFLFEDFVVGLRVFGGGAVLFSFIHRRFSWIFGLVSKMMICAYSGVYRRFNVEWSVFSSRA